MVENDTSQLSFKERQEKKKQRNDLRHYLISFALMVLLTILAFYAVASDTISSEIVPLFIVLLAVIQAAYQMFYFMHMKDRGHYYAILFIAMGLSIAVLAVATLMTLIWYF